jgi:ribose-phosphate pyrophosphokinase
MEFVKFETKQFSSGEWQVKIAERIQGIEAIIHWNWFYESQRDLMLLLSKIGAIKKQYGAIRITVHAPYLPYARQDRVFEVGQDIAIETLLAAIRAQDNVVFVTMALHCRNKYAYMLGSSIMRLRDDESDWLLVYPDENASRHYDNSYGKMAEIYFDKIRDAEGVPTLLSTRWDLEAQWSPKKFLICDDICAGGRTFIECATKLRELYGDDIKIELMVYHAFLDFGLDNLKASGISKIYIINPDSYEYIIKLYPNEGEYFEYKELQG